MGLYIKDMKMPKTESEVLIIAIKSDGSVYPVRIDGDGQPMVFPNEEMKNCAVPVQEPHGRMIDADAPISLIDTRGEKVEVTVAHIIEKNQGIVKAIIPESEKT